MTKEIHHHHDDSCFRDGTLVWITSRDGTFVSQAPIETIKCGDTILAASEHGLIVQQPVVYTSNHAPDYFKFIKITLHSGKSVSPTKNHYMPVLVNGKPELKLAEQVQPGDVFWSRSSDDQTGQDEVIAVSHVVEKAGSTHVIIPEGYLLVNDIAGSSRAIGDMSETLTNLGFLIYKTLGTNATIKFAKFGDWWSETWMDRMLP